MISSVEGYILIKARETYPTKILKSFSTSFTDFFYTMRNRTNIDDKRYGGKDLICEDDYTEERRKTPKVRQTDIFNHR